MNYKFLATPYSETILQQYLGYDSFDVDDDGNNDNSSCSYTSICFPLLFWYQREFERILTQKS